MVHLIIMIPHLAGHRLHQDDIDNRHLGNIEEQDSESMLNIRLVL